MAEVAIERPDGPVVDTLLGAALMVVVISPNQLKNLRSSYGSAGNKDDRFDAFVLADTLRTDRARLRPLIPDSPATVTLRATCRARKDLVGHRVALANQLRAHLQNVFPGAVGLFRDLDSPISLRFLDRFTTQDSADWLSPKRLGSWLRSVGYCGRVDPAVLHSRLAAAPSGVTGVDGATQAHITRALLAALSTLVEQIKTLTEQIAEQLDLHTDAHIFTSLPRSGTVRAARLLAEIGDCRARFPTAESLSCLAGVAPSTRQSGKSQRPAERPHCQLTAVVSYGPAALYADCDTRRSTHGKAQPPRRLPDRERIDMLAWIAQADQQPHRDQTDLNAAVTRARTHGHTWAEIATHLGITRQAAQQRFHQDHFRQS